MGLSNVVPGKANSIAAGEPNEAVRQQDRPSHAPMFARPGEPEPNAVNGERLQPAQSRPRREPSRTLEEARKLGPSMPEALGVRGDDAETTG